MLEHLIVRESKARYHLPGGYVAKRNHVLLEHGEPALYVDEPIFDLFGPPPEFMAPLPPDIMPRLVSPSDAPPPLRIRRFRLREVREIRICEYELMEEPPLPKGTS